MIQVMYGDIATALRWKLLPILLSSLMLSGCGLFAQRKSDPIDTVSVTKVVDMVKDELSAYARDSKFLLQNSKGKSANSCTGVTSLKAGSITLTLSTIGAVQTDGSVGLAVPLGVVKFDPGAKISKAETYTSKIEIPLTIAESQITGESFQSKNTSTMHLAAAMIKLRDELIAVDNKKMPCLSAPNPIKLTLEFEVVKEATVNAGIEILVFKLSGSTVRTTTTSQLIEVELKLLNEKGETPQLFIGTAS